MTDATIIDAPIMDIPPVEPPVRKKRRKSASGTQMRKRRGYKAVLLSRESLDGRSRVARQFDAIASSIASDLGGTDQLSTIQKHLVEGFAGLAIVVGEMNCKLMLGEQVDITEHCLTVSTLIRAAHRIGLTRIPHLLNGNGKAETPWSPLREQLEREKAERRLEEMFGPNGGAVVDVEPEVAS